jgi:hypothetical protein
MTTRETRICAGCGRVLPVADDQTDCPPANDEVVLDSAGETAWPNEYVCGRCYESSDDADDSRITAIQQSDETRYAPYASAEEAAAWENL